MEVDQLVWDQANSEHIWLKHKVSQDEVEQVVYDKEHKAVLLKNGRVLLLGASKEGRLISIVLSPKNIKKTIWYPVTARSPSKKER